ncbi:MAG TPA: ABC transporter permease [Ruminococcaceae bacterium]|nr:ABC transporter permease [Oscillospiraceae bacterium]
MRIRLFAARNMKEILRDPINLFFGLGFPLILMALLSLINANIPPEANNPMFETKNLAPGLAMFGTAFMALFTGMVLAKDRTSSFLTRLFAFPMTACDFLMGYTLPMLLITAVQAVITLMAACAFGLPVTVNIPAAVLVTVLTASLFIGIGLLCGSLMNDKAVGGICGALLINIAGWLSGVFIPIDLIGGGFKTVAHILPFYHGVAAIKTALSGDFGALPLHAGVVLAYAAVIFLSAVLVFRSKMRGDKQ